MSAPSQFRSKYKCQVIVARHGHDILHPVTGTKIDEVKRLAADFGVHRGEYTVTDVDGRENTFADIAGYFYDLDVDAAAKGWSDDEKEAMRARLIEVANTIPDQCQIHSIPAALPPFPNYDSLTDESVAELCIGLGVAGQALAYERENEKRPAVIAALEAALAAPAEESVEELTAA